MVKIGAVLGTYTKSRVFTKKWRLPVANIVSALSAAVLLTTTVAPAVTVLAASSTPTFTVNENATDPTTQGAVVVPDSFTGFSIDPANLCAVVALADPSNPKSAAFKQLFENLGPGTFRVGGNTDDVKATWSPDALAPSCVWNNMITNKALVNSFFEFAQSVGYRVMWQVPLGNGNNSAANLMADAQEAAYVATGLPSDISPSTLYSIEIGNEPNYYPNASTNYQTYINNWISVYNQAGLGTSHTPVTGPAVTTADAFYITPFLQQNASNIIAVTGHYYVASSTATPTPTCDKLSNIAAAKTVTTGAVNNAKNNYNLPFIMNETNSFSSGGVNGASNAFCSALWSADYNMVALNAGVKGLYFHGIANYANGNTNGKANYYSPINPDATAAPEYYGMLFYNQMTKGGGTSVKVGLTGTATNIDAYAVTNPTGLRVALFNRNTTAQTVNVNTTNQYGQQATAIALSNPNSFYSTTGTTLGGSTVAGDGTWSPSVSTPVMLAPGGKSASITIPAQASLIVTYASQTPPPAPSAVLATTATASPSSVQVGQQVNYAINTQNTVANSTASGVTVTATVPANMSIVSASGNPTIQGNTVTWTVGSVANGTPAVQQLVTQLNSGNVNDTVATNVVTTASDNSCTASGSSCLASGSSTIVATPTPMLATTLTVDTQNLQIGQQATYTVTTQDTVAATTAAGTAVTVTVPANMSIVSATGYASITGNTVTWTAGSVTNGTPFSQTFVAQLNSGAVGDPYAVNAAVTTTDTACTPSGCSATVPGTIAPTPTPLLTATLATTTQSLQVGQQLTYNVGAQNTVAGTTAKGVTVTANVPDNLSIVSATGYASITGNTVTWTADSVDSSTPFAEQLVVQLNSGAAGLSFTTTLGATASDNSCIDSGSACGPIGRSTLIAPTLTPVLSTTLTSTNPLLQIGQQATYTATTQNMVATTTASGTVVTVTVSPNMSIVSAPGGASVNGNTATWTIGSVAYGTPVVNSVVAQLTSGNVGDPYSATATVTTADTACTDSASTCGPITAPGIIALTPPTIKQWITNPSVATDLTGWTGVYSAGSKNTRVAGGCAVIGCSANYSLRSVNNTTSANSTGFIDKPHWIDGTTKATTAGTIYTASVWVKADYAGEKISLFLRELNAAGVAQNQAPYNVAKTVPASDTGWFNITLDYKAVGTGDSLSFYVYTSSANAGQGFNADQMSLTSSN